ncbi:MAG: fibronectin type III domain-containing protein, partial [Caldilineaceae bacterium]|nr:fibronectin type III domain-containing protein [Caldilineaceae bacterium]
TIDLNPHAIVDPFNPPILKPTAPVTETFTVHWTGYAVGGATITEYQLFYNYNGEGWKEWTTFPGTETQAQFPYLSMSMGDGVYQFEATATDSAGHTKPRTDTPEATMIVDLADKIHPGAYLPVVHR